MQNILDKDPLQTYTQKRILLNIANLELVQIKSNTSENCIKHIKTSIIPVYTIIKSSKNTIYILYTKLNCISYILIKRVFNNKVV
jgi:hypothetical protein